MAEYWLMVEGLRILDADNEFKLCDQADPENEKLDATMLILQITQSDLIKRSRFMCSVIPVF